MEVLVHEPLRRAADRWVRAAQAMKRAERLKIGSKWLIASSQAVLLRPNGLIGWASDRQPATPPPLFALGQSVRHPERTDIGAVIGLIFGIRGRALVRWVDGATFEAVGLLIEVGQPAA